MTWVRAEITLNQIKEQLIVEFTLLLSIILSDDRLQAKLVSLFNISDKHLYLR